MIAADHDRCRQLAAADHFVKRQAQPGALSQADPADPGRQPLEADALSGHIQPVVEVFVVGDQLFNFRVGAVDILRIAGKRRPAEWANTPAEQRTNIGGNKAREVKSVFHPHLFRHLADVVAVIEGGNALLLEGEHGFNVFGH